MSLCCNLCFTCSVSCCAFCNKHAVLVNWIDCLWCSQVCTDMLELWDATLCFFSLTFKGPTYKEVCLPVLPLCFPCLFLEITNSTQFQNISKLIAHIYLSLKSSHIWVKFGNSRKVVIDRDGIFYAVINIQRPTIRPVFNSDYDPTPCSLSGCRSPSIKRQ